MCILAFLWLQNWQMWIAKQGIYWDCFIVAKIELFESFEVLFTIYSLWSGNICNFKHSNGSVIKWYLLFIAFVWFYAWNYIDSRLVSCPDSTPMSNLSTARLIITQSSTCQRNCVVYKMMMVPVYAKTQRFLYRDDHQQDDRWSSWKTSTTISHSSHYAVFPCGHLQFMTYGVWLRTSSFSQDVIL